MSPPAPDNPWDSGGDLASHAGDTGGDTAWDTGLADETVPDVTALIPTEGWASWSTTLDDFDLGILDVYEYLAGKAASIGWPFAAFGHALACAKGMRVADFVEVMDTLYKLTQKEERIDMSDPCQIRRMAKIGNCVVRRYYGISFGPDLQDFWLDGKAKDEFNLTWETFQFPPDARGNPRVVAYYPMDTGWFFGRVGSKVEKAMADSQELSFWEGVRDRLRAPVDKIFPVDSGFSGKDVSPLRTQVPVGTGPSTFHTTGVDWIYPGETVVTFKHPSQDYNEADRQFGDAELFLAGGMTVISEVQARAIEDVIQIDETELEGWTVMIESWQIRISDRVDYHGKEEDDKSLGIPLGPVVLELPDQLFLDLQSKECPGEPKPVDFDVVSDAWHQLPFGALDRLTLFIPKETYKTTVDNAFGGTGDSFDFLDPATGQGIKLLDI